MAKAFYAPVFVSAVPVGDVIELRAINDNAALDVTVSAVAVDMAGKKRDLAKATVHVAGDAVCALTIPTADLRAGEMLSYVWVLGTERLGGDHFAPQPYKSYDLLEAGLTHKITPKGAAFEIEITAQNLALFVSVESDVAGRFSDNAVTLFPGHGATITFTPAMAGATPRFTLRDLHSATYG
jgi:beta-mannosidase